MRVLTTTDLAARWGMSPGTLANWRSQGRGPRFKRAARTPRSPILYALSDVVRFEKQHWNGKPS